jgi:DNA-binding SARP family transcriptional activator/DNA-binding XRE family transcriptional regulator
VFEQTVTNFGNILQMRRLGAGLTQRGLAEVAGMSLAAIRDLEQGRRSKPRTISLRQLASALGLDDVQLHELTRAARRPPVIAVRAQAWAQQSMMPKCQIWLQILGPVMAWRNGDRVDLGPPKQRALLALLAFRSGYLIHRESIIEALWDEPPVSAVNLIHGYVGRLRRALEPTRSLRDRGGRLVTEGASYRLNLTSAEFDLLSFRQLVERAHTAYKHAEPGVAVELYSRAIDLWQDEPLVDIDRCRSHPAVASLKRERTDVVLRYADCCDKLGQSARALSHLWPLTASDPLYEPAHARLMIALAQSGDQAAAVRVFEGLRRRLDNELGVYPGPEVASAHAQILK